MPSDQNFMFPAVEYDIEYSTSMVLGQPLKYKQIISHGWNQPDPDNRTLVACRRSAHLSDFRILPMVMQTFKLVEIAKAFGCAGIALYASAICPPSKIVHIAVEGGNGFLCPHLGQDWSQSSILTDGTALRCQSADCGGTLVYSPATISSSPSWASFCQHQCRDIGVAHELD
ncbi:hypothetical protein N7497_009934 [Penicillium chrysogenum]|nr:hypothetical protein N7497_009934 [Penicillium chrysogenum]